MEYTYWNSRGKHQELYNKLQKELVPEEGFAKSTAGEMLRCTSNVYWDIYNNGGMNLGYSREEDLSEFLMFLKRHEFPKLGLLQKFFKNFEVVKVKNQWDDEEEYNEGYENFDDLFTPTVEEALEGAVDLMVIEAEKLNNT